MKFVCNLVDGFDSFAPSSVHFVSTTAHVSSVEQRPMGLLSIQGNNIQCNTNGTSTNTHTHTHFTPIVVYPTSDTNNKVMYILFDVRDVRVRVVVIVYVADDDDVSKTHGEASVCDYTSRVVSKRRAAGNRRRGRTYETYIAVCKACANLSVCVCVAVYISRCCSVYLFKSRHKHSIYK